MKKILLLSCALLMLSCGKTSTLQISVEQVELPVLTQKGFNPIAKIMVVNNDPSNPSATLESLHFDLSNTTDLHDIAHLELFPVTEQGYMSRENGSLTKSQKIKKTTVLSQEIKLESDTTYFWLSATLKDTVKLTNRISVKLCKAKANNGDVVVPEYQAKALRTGVALRQHKQDGVDTSRIPGLATSTKGTLLAIYDARWDSSRDLQGNIDIALNRSFDGGETWQPMQIAIDMKQWGGLPEKYNGVSDGTLLVDTQTGDLYIAGLWMHGVLDGETGKWTEGLTEQSEQWIHQWHSRGSQQGFEPKQTSQFLIVKSTDDGESWSEPINITKETKREEWWLYAPAPGQGITLQDGTLVLPTQGRDKEGLPFSNITYSRDQGKSWTTSNPAYNNTTECMAVELEDGSIMLNMRDNRNRSNPEGNGRRICTTTDLGETWTEHSTSRNALIEPTCMASIHRHNYTKDGQIESILIFCNPNSVYNRDHITLKVSYDNGESWPEQKWILLDQYSGRGYSCITSVDEDHIGVVYESSQADMVFQKISLDELL